MLQTRFIALLTMLLSIVFVAVSTFTTPIYSHAQGTTPTPNPTPFAPYAELIYRDGVSLYLATTQGYPGSLLTKNNKFVYACPAISPDSKQLAAIGGEKTFDLLIAPVSDLLRDSNTESRKGITPKAILKKSATTDNMPGGSPSFSPDGKQIAFVGQSAAEFYVVGVDGRNLTPISAPHPINVDWSPDGTRFVIFGEDQGGAGIFTLKVDGSGLSKLLDLPADDVSVNYNKDHFFVRDVVWPRWSPDGTQIAFASTKSGNLDLYIMNADGSNVQQLTKDEAAEYSPAWSPDGRYLAYVVEKDGLRLLYLYHVASGAQKELVAFRDGGCPIWKPDSLANQ
ncbi:MAG: PD40 domain-containing protein [Anaerolineae bacterium]|nr:PD40 domain-containing protein [Anaerolineae bacterium]